jgi:hypothetical protein
MNNKDQQPPAVLTAVIITDLESIGLTYSRDCQQLDFIPYKPEFIPNILGICSEFLLASEF